MKLTKPQERLLRDMWPDADNDTRRWYYRGRKYVPTLSALARLGLADVKSEGFGCDAINSARITEAGKKLIGVDGL